MYLKRIGNKFCRILTIFSTLFRAYCLLFKSQLYWIQFSEWYWPIPFEDSRILTGSIPQNNSVFLHPSGLNPPLPTIVTAFIDIGDQKHAVMADYYRWLDSWQKILNPVVFFTDTGLFARRMSQLRRKLQTKIEMVDRRGLWAFQLIPNISTVFSQWFYPHWYPMTTVPEYAAIQHAKYDFMEEILLKNPFKTDYFMWLDSGFFRNLNRTCRSFAMLPPKDLQENTVLYTEVTLYNRSLYYGQGIRARSIFTNLLMWIGGGLFLGKKPALVDLIRHYRSWVERLLGEGWMGTDEQVLMTVYFDSELFAPWHKVPVQIYSRRTHPHIMDLSLDKDAWFFLGYALRNITGC